MFQADIVYKEMVDKVLREGALSSSRSGETLSCFGHQYILDLREGFPLLTTKFVDFNKVMHELNWFLRGETNVNTLKAPQLWSPWADKNGNCGPIYGHQWRSWQTYVDDHGAQYCDQIKELIKGLKEDPNSRRHIVSAWNVSDLEEMSLSPCHCFFQCYVRGSFLDLQLYQRSADLAIGVPFNIASYALLIHKLAREVGLEAGRLIHSFGNLHIYTNHLEKLKKQMEREVFAAPSLRIHGFKSFWQLVEEDDPDNYHLIDYRHGKFLKYEVAV